jgi:hypothetical protein
MHHGKHGGEDTTLTSIVIKRKTENIHDKAHNIFFGHIRKLPGEDILQTYQPAEDT